VALAVLMPIVASMGGIAGSQTLTIMIRAMALGKISETNAPWLLKKELAVGSLNGLIWGIFVTVMAILWFNDVKLGMVIGVAIIINFFCCIIWCPVAIVIKTIFYRPCFIRWSYFNDGH
jgi:magnesium transporter